MKERLYNFINRFEQFTLDDHKALIILFSLTFIIFIPFLFLGKIFLDGDTIMYTYPIAYFLSSHSSVLINELSLSGYPITTAFHIGFFNPLYQFFFTVFNFLTGYHLILFFDFILAVFFTYKFLRLLKTSVQASFIGTIAFVFSQWSIVWMSSLNITHAIFLLPALFYCSLKIINGKSWYGLLFGLILGFAFLGTHYQYIQMALIGVGLFLLYDFVVKFNQGFSHKDLFKIFLIFGGSSILGFLIGAPQIIKTLEFFPLATRSIYIVYQPVWPIDLIRYILPGFNIEGISVQEFLPYIGIVTLFFAFIAVFNIRSIKGNNYKFFFLGLFIFSLLITLKYSPIFLLIKYLPLLEYFAQPARFLYLANFSLAILSAYGFDYLLFNRHLLESVKLRYWTKFLVYSSLAVIFLSNLVYFFAGSKIIILIQKYFDSHMYATRTGGLPLDYYHKVISVLIDKLFFNISLLNIDVIIFLLFSIGLYGVFFIKSRNQLFSNLCILLVVLNSIFFTFSNIKMGDKDILLKKPKIAEFINKAEPSPYSYRTFSLLVPLAQYQKILALNPKEHKEGYIFAREALVGNLHILSGIPIIGGYEPLGPRRYQKMLFLLENASGDISLDKRISGFYERLRLLSMMNGKYVVSPYKLSQEGLELVFSEEVTKFNVPLFLYKNKNFLPRVYFVKKPIFIKENQEKESFDQVTEKGIDFNNNTFIECDDCQSSNYVNNNDGLYITSRTDTSISLKTKSSSSKYLVFSNNFVPGWSAYIDGQEVKIYPANYIYQAIYVPQGEHIIVFSYKI